MTEYKHLFFDLDHTLWDTDRNAKESLNEIYCEIQLNDKNLPSFEAFYLNYKTHNEQLWGLYSENKIGKDALRINRFRYTLEDFNIYDYPLSESIADEFLKRTPFKTYLIDDAIHVLDHLSEKYKMSIITNGFKESQHIKMNSSGLGKYFEHIFISEEIGFNKPDSRIFEHALDQTGTTITEALMIGDTYETDILGAFTAGIDQVFFKTNPPENQKATFIISRLKELLEIV